MVGDGRGRAQPGDPARRPVAGLSSTAASRPSRDARRGGRRLVDLHGQHATSRLLGAAEQRARSTASAAIDLAALRAAQRSVSPRSRPRSRRSAATTGPGRARDRPPAVPGRRARPRASSTTPTKTERSTLEEDRLADAVAHRDAAAQASDALTGEGGALDGLGGRAAPRSVDARAVRRARAPAARRSRQRPPTSPRSCATTADGIDDDPERLNEVRARRHLLRELTRKYGETLEDVIAYRDEARAPARRCCGPTTRAPPRSTQQRTAALAAADSEARRVGDARRARPRPKLASAVRSHLTELAMPRARIDVVVDGDAGRRRDVPLGRKPR